MSGSGSPVTTQTQTRDPWTGAQPFLSSMYNTAEQYQQGGVGYIPYPGPTQAPLDPTLAASLTGTTGLAGYQASGDPGSLINQMGLGQAQAGNIIANLGITPAISEQLNSISSKIGDLYGPIGGIGNTIGGVGGAIGNLGQSAQGMNAPISDYARLFAQNIGAQNPYLLQSIADQNRLATDRIASSMSGAGRYGSGQYADVMARAQAEIADPLLAQDYMQRQQLAQAAAGGLGQATLGQAGLYGQQAGLYGQQAGLYGAQAQLYGQQAGLYGNEANLYNQGLGITGQYISALPGMAQAQYLPYQEMAAAGQTMQQRAQQDLQGQIALYNAQQAYAWQELERQAAIMAGAGQLGGTTVTAQTPVQAPLPQRLLGGALVGGGLGSTIGGPFGAGLGAIGGAGLGAFL